MKPLTTIIARRGPRPGARPIRVVPAAVSLAILAACSVPPTQPAAPSVALSAAFGQREPAAAVPVVDGAWWAGYGDPTLTTLVEQSLIANHDVAIALQRVAQARAGFDAQRSRLWPTLGV